MEHVQDALVTKHTKPSQRLHRWDEAVRAGVVGEVEGREVGELLDDVAVLGHPPVVVLEHHEHHLPVVPARGDVERDDAVVELVVHVADVVASGEDAVSGTAQRCSSSMVLMTLDSHLQM